MMQINVTGGTLDQRELDAYIARANTKYPIGSVQALDVHIDGDFVDLKYHLAPRPMTRWNNAKTAEEKDRVKHI